PPMIAAPRGMRSPDRDARTHGGRARMDEPGGRTGGAGNRPSPGKPPTESRSVCHRVAITRHLTDMPFRLVDSRVIGRPRPFVNAGRRRPESPRFVPCTEQQRPCRRGQIRRARGGEATAQIAVRPGRCQGASAAESYRVPCACATPTPHRPEARVTRPVALVSVDVDPVDLHLVGYGYRSLPPDPLVYTTALPRLLDCFGRCGVRATFFVVARDAPAHA